MFVKYSPKVSRIKVIPLLPTNAGSEGYAFDNDSVTLRPGTNELTEKEWAAIQPHIKDQIGREIVAFSVPIKTGADGKQSKAKTLKDVPVSTARKIIQECQDPKTLKKWFNQELPDELLLVLSKRMRKLKIEPDDLEDDDADTDLKDEITTEGDSDAEPETEPKADSTDTEGGDTGEDEGGGEDGPGKGTEGGDSEEKLDEDADQLPDFDGSHSGFGGQE
jgi:hypothetical protein